MIYWVAGFSFLVSFSLTGLFIKLARKSHLLDVPNHRSSHEKPTPTGGGLIIVLVSSAASLFFDANMALCAQILLPALGIAAIGLLDDKYDIPARYRLIAQLLCALTLSLSFLVEPYYAQAFFGIALPQFAALITLVLFQVWMLNLYNFMDGIDGLAGSQIALTSLFLATLTWSSQSFFTTSHLALATATIGFLIWNWSPAKIFMGDVGSSFAGFLLAALAIYGCARGDINLHVIAITHMAFIFDATFTLFSRLFRGQKIYEAHREHFYQKLIRSGFSHRFVSSAYIAVNLFWLFPLAWFCHTSPEKQWSALLLASTSLLLARFSLFSLLKTRHEKSPAR